MTVKLPVKVVPGASRDGLAGWLGDMLKVRVSAPPERGKANSAVEKVIADALQLNRDCVVVIKGKTSPKKQVEISGLAEEEVMKRLSTFD